MITLKSCPVCNSDRIIRFHQAGLAPRVNHEIMPGVQVKAAIITCYSVCQNCNVIFQNPRLSDTELEKYYNRGYYRRMINATEEEIDTSEKCRAKTDAEIIKQNISEVISHLDIGAGRGYLLEAVGANIKVGVEPEFDYPKVKDMEVYPRMDQIPRQSFDLVTAIHVLEHEPAPLDYLKNMVKFLKKNGCLVVEVPTWQSPDGPLRLAHLYHFEPDVLKNMCSQAGLSVIHEQFTPHLLLICKLDDNK